MSRNVDARNCGFKTRDMRSAGFKAIAERGKAFRTQAQHRNNWSQFVDYLKNETGIRRLNDIDKNDVLKYAQWLQDHEKDYSASTMQNYVSSVNVVMDQARLDRDVHVDPVKDANLPTKSGVTTDSKYVSKERHEETKDKVSQYIGAILDLQREWGFRLNESSLFNAQKGLEEAKSGNDLHIFRGAKGGRERYVPLSNNADHRARQVEALEKAARAQGDKQNLIPKDMLLKDFKSTCYRELHDTDLKGFHCERHTFANDRYEEKTSFKSPVESGLKHGKTHIEAMARALNIKYDEAKELDSKVRAEISQELGHNRVDVTNAYLG